MENQRKNFSNKSFFQVMKSNFLDFLLIYIFVGVIPFVYSGFEFDKFGLGLLGLSLMVLASGVVLFFLYCLIVFFVSFFGKK